MWNRREIPVSACYDQSHDPHREAQVRRLMAMGFDEAAGRGWLACQNGDLDSAAEWLLSGEPPPRMLRCHLLAL
jgi:uncharacterized UBP type Zn finger protein